MATLGLVAESVGGRLVGADVPFESVSTDTRTLQSGQLFFALRGARFDAAAFVEEAARRGAAAAVVSRRQAVSLPQVEVADPRMALGRFARAWRRRFTVPVIGVTGSNGKTTVKEMIAAILRAGLERNTSNDRVLVTQGNLNNEIGLPLTVLRLRPQHRAAVLEMGASHVGEIAYLTEIAAPTIGIVTNAGPAHLEGFGSLEGVAAGKGELFAGLPADGVAVINRDDRFYGFWRERAGPAQQVAFGLHAEADFRAEAIESLPGQGLRFRLITPSGAREITLPMAGPHNVANALGAAAAAMSAGADLAQVATGLGTMANVPGRLRALDGPTGITVYDDTYNANPGSVAAAVAFLAALPVERWLVLGDMAELGVDSDALHRQVGQLASDAGIHRLFCLGVASRAAADAFGPGSSCHDGVDALLGALGHELHPGVAVLVKGSRSMGMERVVRALTLRSGEGEA